MKKILDVKNLFVNFTIHKQKIYALRDINFSLFENETIAIVGESGSGKSVLAQSILRLIDAHGSKIEGQIFFKQEDLLSLKEKKMQKIRGKKISMIFQDPFMSLNPTMKIGKQILEAIGDDPSKNKVLEILNLVGIDNNKYSQYPHHLSGGQRQRVMIAIAIASKPDIIIADEITTALDVTIQDEILSLLEDIKKKTKASLIFITHDLSIVARMADRIYVMYGGKFLEHGLCEKILLKPNHPYTNLLLQAIPRLDIEKKLISIKGFFSTTSIISQGCLFYNRCPKKLPICENIDPNFIKTDATHEVACHLSKNNKTTQKKCLKTLSKSKI